MTRRKRGNAAAKAAANIVGVSFEERVETCSIQQIKLIEKWRASCWAWLSGKDLDGTPLIWTKDEIDKKTTVKPFPSRWKYLQATLEVLCSEDGLILIDKARQMYVSTLVLLYFDWICRFHDARRIIWSKITEHEAKEMLKDKVRFPSSRLPLWVQHALPQESKPQVVVPYTDTNSYMLAVAENVAEAEARGGAATAMGIDEAARQVYLEKILEAALPMCAQIIALTTATLGNPGAEMFYALLRDPTMDQVMDGMVLLKEK